MERAMKAMTKIEEALAANGIVARDVRLRIALAEYRNNGGSYEQAQAELDAAYEKGSGGLCPSAGVGQRSIAPASRPNDDGAATLPIAAKASRPVPTPSSPPREGGGHGAIAAEAGEILPPPSRLTRSLGRSAVADKAVVTPSMPKRGAAQIAAAQSAVAASLFRTTILPDGRALAEVMWSECPALARRYRHASRLLMAIHNHAVPADPNTPLTSIVSEDGLKTILETVERFNDIH